MTKIAALILLLLASGAGIARAEVIQIANGDVAGIILAIQRANETGEATTLQLAENGRYVLSNDTAFPIIHGDLRIMGNGATMTTDGSGAIRTLFIQIGESGTVLVDEVFFSQIVVASPIIIGFISNKGALLLRSTSFDEIVTGAVKDSSVGLILNSGDLMMENVSIGNISVTGVIGDQHFAVLILNDGSVSIKNSTLLSSDEREMPALWNLDGGSFVITNSILANITGAVCFGDFSSDGPNLVTDESCQLDQALHVSLDQLGIATLADNGGRIPTFAIDNKESPAIDAGDNATCLAVDARGLIRPADGDLSGTATCDLGAFELDAVSLDGGRVNGLFYDPTSDGHYVTLQRLSSDRVLVIWNTFDTNGAQAWVFGVGALKGNRVEVAEVYQNVGGVLQPNGPPQGQVVEFWGRFEVEVTSCQGGSFRYESTLPGFSSGEFSMERLASVHGLECDTDESTGISPLPLPDGTSSGKHNGIFFDPDSDGHYVTLQRLTNGRILVIWNTFDSSGAQAWVFGVGTLEGDRIEVVEVYQSIGGVLQLNGPPQGQVVDLWGRFEVEVTSCQGGSFRYESTLPGFRSGDFALNRLAFIDGLECED